MNRRVLLWLSVLALVAQMLIACAAPAVTPAGDGAADTGAEGERVSLTIFRNGDSWDPDNAYLPLIEEAVNMDLDYQEIPSPDYMEKRNIIMASGDYPHVIQVSPTDPAFQQYYEDELLQPLDEWLEKYPTIWNGFPPEVWEAMRQPDGNIYSIPRISGIFPITVNYRQDWTEELGIAEPQSLDEFRAMLTAFKSEDPGDIGDQLIPFVPNRLSAPDAFQWVDPVFTAFGVPWNAWILDPDSPDQIIYAPTNPAFKDALIYLQGMLADGLIDETYLVSTERGLFKFYAGIAGATTDWPQFINLRREAIQSAYPDASPKLGYIIGLVGPSGIQGGPAIVPDVRGGALNMSLTIAASPEQVDGFFRLMDWQWTEGSDLMKLGVEGKSYDVVDGMPVRRGRDSVLENDPKYDLYMLDRLWTVEPPRNFAFRADNPNFSGISAEEMAYVQELLRETVQNRLVINYGVDMADPVIADNITDIHTATEEFAAKAILNPDLDVDAAYEEFLAELAQVNLPAVTAKINELNDIEEINATAEAMAETFITAMDAE